MESAVERLEERDMSWFSSPEKALAKFAVAQVTGRWEDREVALKAAQAATDVARTWGGRDAFNKSYEVEQFIRHSMGL